MTLEIWQLVLGVAGSLVAGWMARHKLGPTPAPVTPVTPVGPVVPVAPVVPTGHPILDALLAASKLSPAEKAILQQFLDALPSLKAA